MIIYSSKYYNKYNQIVKHYKELDLKKSKNLYTESHHIIPRCMGGSNNKDNLVRVPARVHFLLHWMLYRIYRTSEMAFAWNMMCMNTHNSRYTSRSFSIIRRIFSECASSAHKGKILTDSHKKKISKSNTGKRHSKETKMKMSQNRHISLAHKQSIINAMTGRPYSDETRAKLSLAAINRPVVTYKCPYCHKIGIGNAMLRYHFENCKTYVSSISTSCITPLLSKYTYEYDQASGDL